MDNNSATQPETPSRIARLTERVTAMVDRLADRISPLVPVTSEDSPEHMARKSISFGVISILVIFGGFGVWAAIAPLDSAAISVGRVVLDSNKKTIQHLEGGIVDKILVREGEQVEAGQPLVRLDETTAKARYDLLRKQYFTARASESRLIAERDGKEEVGFPEELISKEKDDATIAESLDSQRRLFESRRANVDGRISILRQKIEQFREEIKGLESQMVSTERQIALVNEEVAAVRHLVNKGNAPKSRLLSLQRQQADLGGQRGEFRASISRAEQSIGEAELEIINVKNNFLNEVIEGLKEAQTSLSDLEERIRASEDTFNRTNILAPIAGRVTDLQVHTVGGVIKPGDKLMDIIPSDDKLIIEAQVQPQDIDVVRAGLEASVRLSAYKARFVPPIAGTVVQVSADRFDDPQRGIAYYKARIEVDVDQLHELKNVELYPGMPADVLIVTGSRTMLSYLFAPIRESFSKSFREQ